MNLPVLGKKTPPAPGESTPEKKARGLRKKLLRKRVILPAVACILAAAAAVRFLAPGQSVPDITQNYVTAAVERRDITAQISGSGTLQAANSYSVTSLVEGTILTAGFEEGDQVEAGTCLLYTSILCQPGAFRLTKYNLAHSDRLCKSLFGNYCNTFRHQRL